MAQHLGDMLGETCQSISVQGRTLVELLRWRALYQPNRRAYTYLVDGESEEIHLTYAELDRQARAIGALLKSRKAVNGERALLFYPPGVEYIVALFGCLYAGAIAVPSYPPRLNRPDPRLQAIVADAQASIALTTSPILSSIERRFAHTPALEALQWLSTDHVSGDLAGEWRDPGIESDTLALFQYTLGCTAMPKGVMLTHSNLLHNLGLIHGCFEHTSESQGLSWLPPYQNMGLIGGILQPLYVGFPVVLMSPIAFLQKPLRWLEAISRYRATTGGGPNFAYDLCVRKISSDQRAALDLSSWDVAFNGAEPVRHETMERFAEAFVPCGFRREAFYPYYGLAEATLIVSGGKKMAQPVVQRYRAAAFEHRRVVKASTEDEDARLLVGCGQALSQREIVIADPESLTECSSDQVGEVWVAGPGVALGYWNRPDETKRLFQAYLADTGKGPFLRTGDLGFLKDGELFIMGRIKDLIIIHGRNYYPQDIELTAEQSHPALRLGCGAAFSVDVDNKERLVIVHELKRTHRNADVGKVAEAIRRAVAACHELQAYAIVLVKPMSLPRTFSGEVQRHVCRARFLEHSLRVIGSSILDVPSADVSANQPEGSFIHKALMAVSEPAVRRSLLVLYLQEQAARVLHIAPSQVDSQQPLGMFGLDSLMAIEMKHEIETNLGVTLPVATLLQNPSILELASQILREFAAPSTARLALLTPSPKTTFESPLSWGQRALWFLHRLAPDSAAYNIAHHVRISGELDVPALRRAFQALVARHSVLRATFTTLHGEPIQQFHEHVEVCFQHEDASTWSEEALYSRLVEQVHHPFDLAQNPLLRINVFTRSIHEHIVLLVVHHIVADLWSLAVLVRELGELYRAEVRGGSVTLLPLRLQYADYVRWQSEMLDSPEGERLWTYWKGQLAGELPPLNLPTDRPRPSIQTYHGAAQSFELAAELLRGLRVLGRIQGATLYMTLLAAFQVLLCRYTGQEEILVGSPTAGRDRAELSGLVGYFVNPVVLRANLTGNPTFTAFLGRVRRIVLDAFAHQGYPFGLLVERLQPERDASRSPIFQAMFVLQKAPQFAVGGLGAFALGVAAEAHTDLGGLKMSPLALEQHIAQFDLTLAMAEVDDGLVASFQYNADLFEAATIARMARHLQGLLKIIVAGPDQRLLDMPILTETARHQLVVEWNDTRTEYPQDRCIHELFEAQVEQTPDAVAVVACFSPSDVSSASERDQDHHLTYQKLNGRANQLAHHLRRLGVGPEVLVGICVERSLEMVIGLLGILKAGGAYVPLDAEYPQERLTFMFTDTQAPVLLTQQRWVEKLPEHGAHVICPDTIWDVIAQESEVNPRHNGTADNLAYVMYTSGSTGRPKGASIVHQSVVRLVKQTNYAKLTAREIYLQFAPISFDASTFEIWASLLNGARLVVFFSHTPSLKELGRTLQRHHITTLWLTAGLFHVMVDEQLEDLEHVHQLLAGGDVLSPSHVHKVLLELKNCLVINGYGPTENTTFTCCYPMTRDHWSAATIPIGRPIANTQVYLLDRHLRPVPVGVVGELYTGGAGLARGYLGRPELTAEALIPYPFSDGPGRRLYRTGDLARYLPDGVIEFLGRTDYQVKIRGFRVELGEIETVLNQHPAVQEAVVLAHEDTHGDKRLVAYLVPCEGQGTTINTLRRFLQGALPDYMVPSIFVTLEALPLTPNGKVDRKALAVLGEAWPRSEKAYVAPRTPVEELLAGIWAQLLKLERVSICDSFFELGGHSLLAAQLMSRVRETFQVNLPLHCLFETPTIAGLAETVEEVKGSSSEPVVPRIERASRGQYRVEVSSKGVLTLPGIFKEKSLGLAQLRPFLESCVTPTSVAEEVFVFPLSFAQQRLWFLDQLGPDIPAYNIPVAVRFTGVLHTTALEQSLNEIVRRHEALRTTFAVVGEQPVQIVAPALTLTLSVVDLQEFHEAEREAEAAPLIAKEARRPFDLAQSPLLRTTLLRLGQREHILLLIMHHIISDGWSMGVFVREITTLYNAFSAGQPSPIPELPIQYADFALWQRQWLQGKVLEAQMAYWRQQLSGIPVLELSADRPRPAVQTFQGAMQEVFIPKALTEALKALSRRERVTLFMTLLAVFKTLLYRYTGQDDVPVGSPTANRSTEEAESLIGFFVNTLVLRTDLSGNPTFHELLPRVREVTLGAHAHQDIPFEKLVEELEPERDMSRTPLFQMMFALQNAPMPSIELLGLSSTFMRVDSQTVKFDLTLDLTETAKGLQGWFEYNTALFDRFRIERMAKHFQTLLEGIVFNPDQRLADLSLLTEIERHQLLVEWNDTLAEYPRRMCLHGLFETQVERTPDAVAAILENQHLTYRELNRRADQLAHHLQALGVGPEEMVGIYKERSLEMVIGLLGVLKAGGAYVPLDPTYPKERSRFVLQDTRAVVLLSQRRLIEQLPEHEAHVLCLDTEWPIIAQVSQGKASSSITADNAAYVLYTSGSTGKPKGVVVQHRSAVALVNWAGSVFDRANLARVLGCTSICFDLSVFEIFVPLSYGGAVVLVETALQLAVRGEDYAVTLVNTVPSAMREVLRMGRVPGSVRVVNLAGEPLSTLTVRQVYQERAVEKVYDLYGPTEDTTYTTYALRSETGRATIGRPVTNTQIYLLDARLNPVPVGVAGEVYIGGEGLARGYLNCPDLTGERFIPHPFDQGPGKRLYKTGDIGRYLSGGDIEYLGRVDYQVKIRGFRIELGEIETVLGEHPGVKEAVVVAREDQPGDKRLVAYLVAHQGRTPGRKGLRRFLQERLPSYMVPSVFIELEALPLTPNGKVNRQALPEPARTRPQLEKVFVTPHTPTERMVADIWAEALGVERVGVHDSFFELGGHSLLVTRIISRLRDAFQVELSLPTFFRVPTVMGVSSAIDRAKKADSDRLIPAVKRVSRDSYRQKVSRGPKIQDGERERI